MNTPAHVVLSAVALGRRARPDAWKPITLGAVLPDLPMIVFYGYQRLLLGTPEPVIWAQRYHEPVWQALFDSFNSLPLIAILTWIGWRMKREALCLVGLSMALHCAADLPLHAHDGHRHFFPLSDWRFDSPVSYWDPRHFGHIVAPIEFVFVVGGCVLLIARGAQWRWLGGAILAADFAFGEYASSVWGG